MKNSNIKRFLSACAVLSISATAAFSAISFTACSPLNNDGESKKLITADINHAATVVPTALGEVPTLNNGTTYYVAPDGDSSHSGTSWDDPKDIYSLLTGYTLKAGDTVYFKPGTYKETRAITIPESIKGAYNNYIRLVNAALEPTASNYTAAEGSATEVVIDFSGQSFDSTARGVQLYGDYFYWYGIDICGAGDNGLYIGGDYNTVEFSEFYNNRDTGLQLGRIASNYNTVEEWPSYNLIKNCTSHNNYDNETYGENADGFAAKLTVGYGNVFDGCIAYRNSDDGWDLYAKTDSGNIGCIIIYNCVAFENGFLEYTQEECNSKFPTYNEIYNESNTNSYLTRDGDGNGFKLGGSVMEGDVIMYNCLSFNNRMHGVTDNSNPGYLKVEGVTSYDNSAYICDDSNSEYFGKIISMPDEDSEGVQSDNHANIDVARQVYSYNSVIRTLSINSSVANKAKADAYRGSVTDSVLSSDYLSRTTLNLIDGSIDADTKNTGGQKYTGTISGIYPENIFKQLPITKTVDSDSGDDIYTYALSGLNDLYTGNDYENAGISNLNPDRVHLYFRNADNSINMKEILALNSDGTNDKAQQLLEFIDEKNIGAVLNETSWEDYTHFYDSDFVDKNAASQNAANLARALETLTINTDANAVYQDFEIPVMLNGCTITWVSSDESVAVIGKDVEVSYSQSKYVTVYVYRPLDEEAVATLTATVTYGSGASAVSGTKPFTIHVQPGQPSIGTIMVRTKSGDIIKDGGSYVVDRFDVFTEPEILVENGLDYYGKLLDDSQYEYKTTYYYATDKNSPFIQLKGFTPSNAGVYRITQTVTLKSDNSTKSMTYTLYVASTSATVEFADSSIIVNRDGYIISGNLTNATGKIYAVSSTTPLTVTAENIKTLSGVKEYDFRGDSISFQFENTNSAAYTIYYALANVNGKITSDIKTASIGLVEVSTKEDFYTLANKGKIGSEVASTTIYSLTADLDFTGYNWTRTSGTFTGLLNGNGHKISNITMSTNSTTSGLGVFYKSNGATIENIKFDTISMTGGKQQVGIIAIAYGGYYHNIEITNVSVSNGGTRSAGLIGHAFESAIPTCITKVSIVNDDEHKISAGTNHRVGGIVGFIQTSSTPNGNVDIQISDCYVIADLIGAQQVGGIVGALDNAKADVEYSLTIDRCYFGGTCTTTYSTPRMGGMLGYESGAIGGFTITRCISVGTLYRDTGDNELSQVEVALKAASLIVGGSMSTADNTVKNCVAAMEEYETDFDVESYPILNMVRTHAVLESVLGAGYEADGWKLVYGTRPNTGSDKDKYPYYLEAPFVTLTHTY